MLPQFKKLGYSNYTIIRKSDNEKLGSCGLYDREGLDGVDLGFSILPKYERNGYILEASKELIKVAFDRFCITEIKAITTRENIASQNLLKKLGMRFIKTTRIPNDDIELLLFSKTLH